MNSITSLSNLSDLNHSCSDSLGYLVQIVIEINNTTLAFGVVQFTPGNARAESI